MLEKRWEAVPPQSLTTDGTVSGLVTVAKAYLFRVKQLVTLKSGVAGGQQFKIQRIESPNIIHLGDPNSKIDERSDVSAWLVADGATLELCEQPRSTIGGDDILRAAYEEDPVVAHRTLGVDELGRPIGPDNPAPFVNRGAAIDVVWDELEVLTRDPKGNILTMELRYEGVVVRTLTFTYDAKGDLVTTVKS